MALNKNISLRTKIFQKADLCWFRLISWPKVLLHMGQAKGRRPLCARRACTSRPCGDEKILAHFMHE